MRTANSWGKILQVWSTPPLIAISTAHHWYSFPAPNSPTVFFPLSLDRGLWVKHRGECSITTRSDPIKYRFNQPCSQRVNTKSHQSRGNQRPDGVGSALRLPVGRLAKRLSRRVDPGSESTSAAVAQGDENMILTSERKFAFVYGLCGMRTPLPKTEDSPHRQPSQMAPAANRWNLFLRTGSSPVIWSTAPQWPIKVHCNCCVTFRVPKENWNTERGCSPH